jgi:DNA repair protein RecO (recombination protein O)
VARYNVEAVVLKGINYSDSDKIYTLLSKDYGKIPVLAKGVRKISSRRGGNLDTLNRIIANVSESGSGFRTLLEVELLHSHKHIKKDLERSLAAYYMVELVNKTVEESSENEDVYTLLCGMLEKLDDESSDIRFVVNKFEVLFMKILGYELTLDQLKSFKKNELDQRIKMYVREVLGEDFKSLNIM